MGQPRRERRYLLCGFFGVFGFLSTMVLAIAVLIGAGFLASFVPARRASLVDATTALRQE